MFGATPNTTAAPFLFGSSNQSGFGAASNNSTATFGSQQNKPATGLFGSSTATPAPSTGGGLFGNTATQNQNQNQNSTFGAPASSGGGLFGQKPATTSAQSTAFGSKPSSSGFGTAGSGGGLFGSASNTGANTNNATNTTGGGLFGSSTNNASTTGGLFGSTNNTSTGGGLFGAKPAAPAGGNLFGTNSASGGLFGGNSGASNGNTFGQTKPSGGLFGTSNTGSTQLGQNQQQQQQQQQQTQLTAMTRVGDLPPQFKKELEDLDKYISTQHLIATTLNGDLHKHDLLIKSIPTDVDYLHAKISSIKQALKFDIEHLKDIKSVNDELTEDINNIMQLIVQLSTPGSKFTSSFQLNDFFVKRIKKYRDLLDVYEGVINESNEAISGLERSCNETYGNIYNVVEVVKNQYALFMELCETLAEIHNEVDRYA